MTNMINHYCRKSYAGNCSRCDIKSVNLYKLNKTSIVFIVFLDLYLQFMKKFNGIKFCAILRILQLDSFLLLKYFSEGK
jgi:hypothetical protein